MKYLVAILSILLTLTAYPAFAFTDSATFVAASTQRASHVDAAALDPTGNFTIEFWTKPASQPTSGNNETFVSKWKSGNGQYIFSYSNNAGTETLLMRLYDSSVPGTNVNYRVTQTLANGTWVQVAAVWTAASHKLEYFINGVSIGSVTDATVSTINSNTGEFDIGAFGGTNEPFDGQMFLVRLWSTTRTASQILTNFCTDLGATTNLNGEWTLDNTLNDDSGNSLTLTNNNSFTFGADIPSTCAAAPVTPTLPPLLQLILGQW